MLLSSLSRKISRSLACVARSASRSSWQLRTVSAISCFRRKASGSLSLGPEEAQRRFAAGSGSRLASPCKGRFLSAGSSSVSVSKSCSAAIKMASVCSHCLYAAPALVRPSATEAASRQNCRRLDAAAEEKLGTNSKSRFATGRKSWDRSCSSESTGALQDLAIRRTSAMVRSASLASSCCGKPALAKQAEIVVGLRPLLGAMARRSTETLTLRVPTQQGPIEALVPYIVGTWRVREMSSCLTSSCVAFWFDCYATVMSKHLPCHGRVCTCVTLRETSFSNDFRFKPEKHADII